MPDDSATGPALAPYSDLTPGGVLDALDGVGLRGDGGHTPGEWGDLRTLPTQSKRVASLLLRLAESR